MALLGAFFLHELKRRKRVKQLNPYNFKAAFPTSLLRRGPASLKSKGIKVYKMGLHSSKNGKIMIIEQNSKQLVIYQATRLSGNKTGKYSNVRIISFSLTY